MKQGTKMKFQLKWHEANFVRKIGKMSNVLLEQLQNIIAETFGSTEISHR